jgi:hypothetical protein
MLALLSIFLTDFLPTDPDLDDRESCEALLSIFLTDFLPSDPDLDDLEW